MGNLDSLSLISQGDIVSINELTLVLKIVRRCDNVKHIMTLTIKTLMSVLKVSTNIITSITDHPIGLAAI